WDSEGALFKPSSSISAQLRESLQQHGHDDLMNQNQLPASSSVEHPEGMWMKQLVLRPSHLPLLCLRSLNRVISHCFFKTKGLCRSKF
ncbi:hypothetical protein AMECASPLE_034061, partial [Ameca splendens]